MNSLSFLEENKQCNCITDGLREGGGFFPCFGGERLGAVHGPYFVGHCNRLSSKASQNRWWS